jgi:hypothetical protein
LFMSSAPKHPGLLAARINCRQGLTAVTFVAILSPGLQSPSLVWSMIRKGGNRFSEKIMLKQGARA